MVSNPPKSKVTSIGVVRKSDTAALITNGVDSFPEDTFEGVYWTGGAVGNTVAILEPTFKPATLLALTQQNNTLAQCIAAMEVNIDGTGYSIDLIEGGKEDKAGKQTLVDFFEEPYPGQSITEIRRKLRVDLESTGNGYMEVIRNVEGKVLMLNYLSSIDMRLIRYDDPIATKKPVVRGGKEIEVVMRVRERRYVQQINGRKVYFKEFGASREVNRETGEWMKTKADFALRGSEVIHFTLNADPKSPYGVPRWINQLPSILGSRKAEEFNLEFFDAGGLPPVLIMVQGGYLGEDVKDSLVAHLSNRGNKHRAVIVEAISSSGSLDSSGTVKMTVERFGSERMSDAMFQNYDAKTEDHVRTAFRLPPMFIGKAQDYNFATAYTAYMVAEAQVFSPERDEFDGIINMMVLKALGVKGYKFRSLPLSLTDVDKQLKAIEMVADKDIAGKEKVSVLNEITGLSLTYEKQEQPQQGAPGAPPGMDAQNPAQEDGGNPVDQKVSDTSNKPTQVEPKPPETPIGQAPSSVPVKKSVALVELADRWASLIGLSGDIIPEEESSIRKEVGELTGSDLDAFNRILASRTLVSTFSDPEGLGDLCGCIAGNHDD